MPLTPVYYILRVTRMLSENQCLFVQVYRALKQPGQVFSRHTTVVLITTEVLFKVFVFIIHRSIKSHQSSCQFILLHLFTVSHAAVKGCSQTSFHVYVVSIPGWSCSTYVLFIQQKRHRWEPEFRAQTTNRSLWYVLIDWWTLMTLNGAWRHNTPHHYCLAKWSGESVPWKAGTAKFVLLILMSQPEFTCYDHGAGKTPKDSSLIVLYCS